MTLPGLPTLYYQFYAKIFFMQKSLFYHYCVLRLFLFNSYLVQAEEALSSQRELFKQAYQAWLTQQLDTFQQLSSKLSNYPIAHYLRYLYLKSRFDQESPVTIQTFLQQYQDSLITQQLRTEWLSFLGKKGRWKIFLANYQPQSNIVLQCYYLQAKIKSKQLLTQENLAEALQIWLVGYSQPMVCDPVFTYLYEQKWLTEELHWQRIRLAMQRNNSSLAKHLAKHLPQPDQGLVKLWQKMTKQPAKTLTTFKQPDTPLSREILLYGLKRLARKHAEAAYDYWIIYQPQYAFTTQDGAEFTTYLALQSVDQPSTKTTKWLALIDKTEWPEEIIRIQLQQALRVQNWPAVLKLIRNLSKIDQNTLFWQYWQARALEQTRQLAVAEQLFERISQQREYYSFLAAGRLGKSYQFQSQPLSANPVLQQRLLTQPGFIRAHELYLVGLPDYARGEWQAALSQLSREELIQAALLAYQWQWYHQAIATLNKANVTDDLKVRFPLAYYQSILRHAVAFELKPAWVYAITWQESAFQEDARSKTGALGLMQLLPATVAKISTKYQISPLPPEALFTPDLNIQLGTAYLHELLNQFSNNYLLVTAAYQAGPGRVKQWLTQYSCVPADVWVELIPVKETREYIQQVMSHTIIFEKQLAISALELLEPMLLDEIYTDQCINQE